MRAAKFPCQTSCPPRRSSRPESNLELRREILRAMNKLSPRLRAVVLLALVEEEPYQSIAEALGISESAVKLRVFRGVRILRKNAIGGRSPPMKEPGN